MNKDEPINNDKILVELIKNQKKIVISDKKLLYNDLKRISKYLSTSIFGDECSLWNGYVTVIKNDEKNSYINFYYCGKKYSLHRLLYTNYIGELNDSEYIKFKCSNKGKCCNINHFYKNNKIDEPNDEHKVSTSNISNPNTPVNAPKEQPKNIIVDFKL
jgi:hypothetical protein